MEIFSTEPHSASDLWISSVYLSCSSNLGMHRQLNVLAQIQTKGVIERDLVDALLVFQVPPGIFVDTFELKVK